MALKERPHRGSGHDIAFISFDSSGARASEPVLLPERFFPLEPVKMAIHMLLPG